MPRSKPTSWGSKSVTPTYEIGLNDTIPLPVLEFFESLPQNRLPTPTESGGRISTTSADESSPKRRKIESIQGIPVAKGNISISRGTFETSSANYSVQRQHVDAQLQFSIRESRLRIVSRPGSPLGLFTVIISIRDHELSPDASKIIAISERKSRQDAPGAIWKSVDIAINRLESKVLVDIDFNLFWNVTPSPLQPLRSRKERQRTQELINNFFPGPDNGADEPVSSPMDFYDAAFVPPKDGTGTQLIEVPGLEATLFPYQRRTLQWLLMREGKRWSTSFSDVETVSQGSIGLGTMVFRKVRDMDNRVLYLSDVFHTLTTDTSLYQQADVNVKGGILAEEMGLGKTLEILGLIILNPRTASPDSLITTNPNLRSSGATMIVTPESLRAQWLSEIAIHAPHLRVKCYKGCRNVSNEEEEEQMVAELASFDIIVTTYSVLSAELHFTEEPPARSRRYERVYRRTKSPLVRISWWRLCLDEAQMIENGYSKAATVARVIPRVNAWGITGTPVKDDVRDLFGLLLFLRYEPYCLSHIWDALTRSKVLFQKLFRSIAVRHTKTAVRDELSLPPQRRFVISMPFTAVEEQHYQTLFEEMLEACGLQADGTPSVEGWQPQSCEEDMRTWLNRLRQAALHPEVGVYNRRILGQNKNRPMRTVDEVLDAMLEQSENTIRSEERAWLTTKLARGQFYENGPLVKEALAIWEDVKNITALRVADARDKLKSCLREQGIEEMSQQAISKNVDDDADSDEELDDMESRGRIGEHHRRLRMALELHHKAVFFCANAHFQIRDNPEMTEPDSDEFERLKRLEEEGYEEAKAIRREILRQVQRKAGRAMENISLKASTQTFTEIPELVVRPPKGIESGRIVDGLEVLYGELNVQANVLDEWREYVVQLLLRSLVDEDDEVETTGEELNESAKVQDELMAYVTTLRAVVFDRQEAVTGQPNELIKHETDTSIKLAKEGEGPAPEKLLQLMEMREKVRPKVSQMTMRGAIGEFRGLVSRLARDPTASTREAVEHKVASDQLRSTQTLLSEQNKAALSLESEIESFKTAMNARLEYYRQLQALSDSVLPYEGARTELGLAKVRQTEESHRSKLSVAQSKHRYLLNLKETGAKSNEPRMCVICQMPFIVGILTICGHQFCKECMSMWFKAHHNCPICKRGLRSSNLHDITIKPQQLQIHSDSSNDKMQDQQQSPSRRKHQKSKKTMIYSEFNSDKLDEIKNIELAGPSFTTKVDTLVRHLLWLRDNDPGAKSIVFSQYRDFLQVLRNAFARFRIVYASIDDPNGIARFKDDPATECFLLHARAHSSGLNLVNASHVFLCEPLLNTALELQAIARVDRIGQQHETTVWLYLVSGTVEESIYNLSVRRRMEHMGRNLKGKSKESTPELLDESIEEANTLELEHAALTKLMSKDKNAGELVDQGDLWECLFGHVTASTAAQGQDGRLREQAVESFLAGEAAEARRDQARS